MNKYFKKGLYHFFIVGTILIMGLTIVVSAEEFIIVSINKMDAGYPWGEGNVPWYYQSAETYSTFMLCTTIILASIYIVMIYNYLKKKSKQSLHIALSLWTLFILLILNGRIN